MNDVTPIKMPPGWPDIDCRHARIRKKLPFLKFILSFVWHGSPYEKLDEYVILALKKRTLDITTAWSDYVSYIPIVMALQKILEKHCWGFAPVFLPADDFRAIGRIETGDLCEVEAIMEIEERFGVTLLSQRRFHAVVNGTMLDIVKFLAENGSKDKVTE